MKERISKSVIRTWNSKDDEFKERHRELTGKASRRMWRREGHREKHGAAASAGVKKKWKDPEYLSKQAQARLRHPNNLEKFMADALERHSISTESEYPLDGFLLDFAIPKLKIDIECDGSYWHPPGNEHDRNRDRRLQKLGWRTLRFTDDQIYNNIGGCIDQISKTCSIRNVLNT